MAINPILGSAVLGIQRGVAELQKDAATIAGANVAEQGVLAPDVLDALVKLTADLHQVQASAAVIRRADQALASLLDP